MRVAIATLGCKINQYDSAVIQDRLGEKHSFVPFDQQADCYIINTCTVTDRADWEARQLVRRAKRVSPEARIVVTGCYAQVSPGELSALPEVDFVVGLNRFDDLLRCVNSPQEPRGQVCVGEGREARAIPVVGMRKLPGHTRAFLKIQEGCNYSCTYCIIPAARGRSRSIAPEEVLSQLAVLAAEGVVEVVLTGIHLGGYGQDLHPRTDLTALVERIADSGLVRRLRLSSLDPREVPERLLAVLSRYEIICDHLHVCLQAGTDDILRSMRRNYGTSYYRDLISRIRSVLPDAALGSDIIVGFPGETDELFARSIDFLESLPLTYFHVFPYSVRRGTGAAGLPSQVPSAVRKSRARTVRELGAKKKLEFSRRFVGRRVSVLLERQSKVQHLYRGYSKNYLPVLTRAEEDSVNREVEVDISGFDGECLVGEMAMPVG
jgi:threonylcarbamoyladenosine tRNA methylthiotransferase MtaB